MAHTPETRTTLADVLNEVYRPMIIAQSPEQALLFRRLETVIPKDQMGGKNFNIHVRYNAMGGVGSAGEGDSLMQSLPGNYDLATLSFYWHYFTMSVSGQAMATSANNVYAAMEALALETDVKTQAFYQMLNRQACADGLAILAQQDGAVAAQVITIDNAGGWSGFNGSNVNGHRYLTINQYIQCRDSSGTAQDGGLLITALTRGAYPETSAYMTVSGTCSSCADGSYYYQAFSTTASNDAYGHEMPGVKQLIDDNSVAVTVQGISATTYPEWRSQIGYGATPGTAEALTNLRMNDLYSDVLVNARGNIGFITTSPAVFTTYAHMVDNQNIIMNAETYDVAYPSLSFNGIPVFQDPYMADEMYFIDPSTVKFYQSVEPGWIDYGGSPYEKTPDKDELQATWRWYLTMGIENRAKNAKLVDITVLSNKY